MFGKIGDYKQRMNRVPRLVAIALAAMAMFGSTLGLPSETRAASGTGAYLQASVECNTVYHQLSLTPAASAAPGLASQTISYRYWILDRTVNSYVAGWNPSGFGTIVHNYQYSVYTPLVGWSSITNPGPVFGPTTSVNLVAGHTYSVYTEYWWLTGGVWYNAGAWTQSYTTAGYAWTVKGTVSGGCRV